MVVAPAAIRGADAHLLALYRGGVVHKVSRLAYMLTQLIVPFLLVALLASYYTRIGCRVAHRRHRRVGWHIVLVGAALAAASSNCFILLGTSLQSGLMPYFGIFLQWMLTISIGGSLLGLVPAAAVVWHNRRRFRTHDRVVWPTDPGPR